MSNFLMGMESDFRLTFSTATDCLVKNANCYLHLLSEYTGRVGLRSGEKLRRKQERYLRKVGKI